MKNTASREHVLDILFPLSLLLAFAAFAMLVLLAAANLYGEISDQSLKTHTASVVTAYLTEKVHQNDGSGAVAVGNLQGTDALILEYSVGNEIYCTYLYQYEEGLRELMVKKGTEFSLGSGQMLLPLQNLRISRETQNLICFSCLDSEGRESLAYAAVRSGEVKDR